MLKRRWLIATIAAAFVSVPAVAQQPGTAIFGGFGQYTMFDDALNLENSFGFGGRIGGYIAPNMWLEAEGSYTQADLDNRPGFATLDHVKYGPISARLMFGFPFGNRAAFSLGGGAVLSNYRKDPVNSSGFTNGYNYGIEGAAGLHFGLGTSANLRVQGLVNYMPNSHPDATLNFRAQAGVDFTPDFATMTGMFPTTAGGPVVWWDETPQPQPGTLELGAFVQYAWLDDGAGVPTSAGVARPDDGLGYGGRAGVFWTPNWQIEGDGQWSPLERRAGSPAGDDVDYSTFALRINYNFPFGALGARSSFLIGAGAVRTNYGTGDAPARPYTYNYGASGIAGIRFGLANRVALRFDGVVDYMPNSEPEATTNFAVRGGLSLFLGGAERVGPPAPPPPPPPPPVVVPPPPPPPAVVVIDTAAITAPIYFDFDKSDIRPDAAATLDRKVPWLQANPTMRIRIEGHADNRGSDEYNLALGQRRAAAARAYLVNRGIAEDRFDLVSFGEERPACTQTPMTEECHQLNRRDEFRIITFPAGGIRRP